MYVNEFYFHVNKNLFSHVRLCTKTRFEKEAQDDSEMAYYSSFLKLRGCLSFAKDGQGANGYSLKILARFFNFFPSVLKNCLKHTVDSQ